MITERKRWMTYTYFNRTPRMNFGATHLFALTKRSVFLMTRVPFPTMMVDLSNKEFVGDWSASTRTKINKAGQEQFEIKRGGHLLEEVLKLFKSTASRKGLQGYTEDDFGGFSTIEVSCVYKEELLLCGHVWLVDGEEKRAMLFVNASRYGAASEEASLIGRAHYYLLWQDGLFLQQKGIRLMDLMGFDIDSSDSQLAGVYQWKAATHGHQEVLYHYYPIWFYVLRKFRNMLAR